MKSIQKNVFYLSFLILIFAGCNGNNNPVSTKVAEVQSLYTPKDNFSVTLQPNGSETFEWAPAKAVDGGMVMYEVAFDSVGGDFSDPIYRVPSDNNGVKTTATITDKTLNKAAAQAGLESEETGKLDWTVISSRGVNEQISPEVRTIQITRLPGFANPPTNLYITGKGTEAGSDIANAMKLKNTGDGQFEIYTKLTTDGIYKFVNNTSDSPREFTIQGNSIKENGNGTTIDHNGVYRLDLDFTVGAAKIAEIKQVEFYSAPHDQYLYQLDYQGDGTFAAKNQPYSFYEWSWGLDSRYKFRLTVNKGGQDTYEWFGSSNGDNSRPNDSTPDSYWYLYKLPDSAGQWDYCYKFSEDKDNSLIDVYVYFQATRDHYTHEVKKVGNQ